MGKGRILVIDDEPVVGLSIQRTLVPQGHTIEVFQDPQAGLQAALAGVFDFLRFHDGHRPAVAWVNYLFVWVAVHQLGYLWRDGRLLATCRGGKAHLNAYLDDYAYVLQGALELLQAEFRMSDLAFLGIGFFVDEL